LVPFRPLSTISSTINWICFDAQNVQQKILREDKELFGIDWKTLGNASQSEAHS
jgi:hypothetical protein